MNVDEGERRHPLWRTVRVVIGAALIPIGIIGLFVPALQGVILLLVAFALLAGEIPLVRERRHKLRRRYPRLFRGHG